MATRVSSLLLVMAATLFWWSWLLMPGVGITDARLILQLVATRRALVIESVSIQLLSAALYVPALFGSPWVWRAGPAVRWPAGLLLLGAMGSAADAVFHLLAFAMTQPGLDQQTLVRVMSFMQGPGLMLVAPFILSFFVGGVWLSIALARAKEVSWSSACAHGTAAVIAVVGGASAAAGLMPGRTVGLAVLAAVSVGQAWIGVEQFLAAQRARSSYQSEATLAR